MHTQNANKKGRQKKHHTHKIKVAINTSGGPDEINYLMKCFVVRICPDKNTNKSIFI